MNATPAGPDPAPTPPARDLRVVYLDEPREERPAAINWIWHGYLAARNMTLLTSYWKTGKTTLVSVLLTRLGQGGTLAGLPVRAGRAIVVSEEPEEHWDARNAELRFGKSVGFICQPFRGRPSPDDWLALIEVLAARHQERSLDLVVIDPLASFLPARTENDAGVMLDALLPLQRLTTLGICVLILHHPRKGESAPGRAARGSGALTGHMDILIEMDWFGAPYEDDRRRKLSAYSRHKETVRRLVIEWSADGKDYASLGDFSELDRNAGWPVLMGVLEEATRKLTKQGIRQQWPADYACPSDVTLWRWLETAVKEGQVRKSGTGRRQQPFLYWLPGKEEEWEKNPYRLPDLPEVPDPEREWVEIFREEQRQKKEKPPSSRSPGSRQKPPSSSPGIAGDGQSPSSPPSGPPREGCPPSSPPPSSAEEERSSASPSPGLAGDGQSLSSPPPGSAGDGQSLSSPPPAEPGGGSDRAMRFGVGSGRSLP